MADKKVEVKFGYKKATLADMMEYIENNYPDDKEWFKRVATEKKEKDANGKYTGNYVVNIGKDGTKAYNHINARQQFFEKYAPELIPQKKAKAVKKTDALLNW